MTPYNLPNWFVKTLRLLVIEVAGLIILGGTVRVMNAGLACPDWPLCFGDFIPDYHPQVYFEFIHRALAGIVAIVTTILVLVLFLNKQVPSRLKLLGGLSMVVLIAQIVMGGLTVLLQLKSGVVAAHLGLGTGFFALLLWISLDLKQEASGQKLSALPAYVVGWTSFILFAVYIQILLGGLVASNYAALACTDFPTCQGQWFPSFEGPVGLHIIHRLGAYTIALLAVLNLVLLRKVSPVLRKNAGMMMGVVFVQIGLGIANVLFYTPPLLAVLHLAMGLKIFYVAIKQYHFALSCQSAEASTFQNRAVLQDGLS